MSICRSAAVAGIAAATALSGPALAAEHQLDFRLVVMPVEVRSHEVANVEGQTVALMRMQGVAYFKDGRVATKQFVFNTDYLKGSGPFFGYSTYTFEDGSSLTARFAGTARAGQPLHGEYTVLSGTGVYAGATGSGSFDGMPSKLVGGNLLGGRFVIRTP